MAQSKHEKIERNVFLMIVLTLMTVSVGGLVEIVPLFFQHSTTTPIDQKGNALAVKPYDPVRLVGRDIYVREGFAPYSSDETGDKLSVTRKAWASRA